MENLHTIDLKVKNKIIKKDFKLKVNTNIDNLKSDNKKRNKSLCYTTKNKDAKDVKDFKDVKDIKDIKKVKEGSIKISNNNELKTTDSHRDYKINDNSNNISENIMYTNKVNNQCKIKKDENVKYEIESQSETVGKMINFNENFIFCKNDTFCLNYPLNGKEIKSDNLFTINPQLVEANKNSNVILNLFDYSFDIDEKHVHRKYNSFNLKFEDKRRKKIVKSLKNLLKTNSFQNYNIKENMYENKMGVNFEKNKRENEDVNENENFDDNLQIKCLINNNKYPSLYNNKIMGFYDKLIQKSESNNYTNNNKVKEKEINYHQCESKNDNYISDNIKDNEKINSNVIINDNNLNHNDSKLEIKIKMNKSTNSFCNYKKFNKNSIGQISNSMNKSLGIIIPNLPNYKDLYKDFSWIFNGFYLNSSNKSFNLNDTMNEVLKCFSTLINYENTSFLSEVDDLSLKIINSETNTIQSRIEKLSEKLMYDNSNMSDEKLYLIKKMLELQKQTIKSDNKESITKNSLFFKVILSRPEIYDIVSYCIGLKPDWRELPHGMMLGNSWNIMWTYSSPNIDLSKLLIFQKVNHLINNRFIGRKDLLKKSIERIKKLNNKTKLEFDIIPETFILSKEYIEFMDAYNKYGGKNNPENIWIVKPIGKSRGRGIFLTNQLVDVQPIDGFLVQKYISDPLLIDDGYKFDLRIYVLVTSVNPLEAFIYKDGFARVSNFKYDKFNLDRMIHLTNAAIQNKESKSSSNIEKIYGGSKICFNILRYKLKKCNIDFDDIWIQIRDLVLKSLLCVQREMSYSPSTFELFGYDVIVNSVGICKLIEVNISPSLERSNVLDDEIKLRLIKDTINIIDPPKINKHGLVEIINRRLHIENRNHTIYSPNIQLNYDINCILDGKIPRKYGEEPKNIGNYEWLSPSSKTEMLLKAMKLRENDKFDIKKDYLSNIHTLMNI